MAGCGVFVEAGVALSVCGRVRCGQGSCGGGVCLDQLCEGHARQCVCYTLSGCQVHARSRVRPCERALRSMPRGGFAVGSNLTVVHGTDSAGLYVHRNCCTVRIGWTLFEWSAGPAI